MENQKRSGLILFVASVALLLIVAVNIATLPHGGVPRPASRGEAAGYAFLFAVLPMLALTFLVTGICILTVDRRKGGRKDD